MLVSRPFAALTQDAEHAEKTCLKPVNRRERRMHADENQKLVLGVNLSSNKMLLFSSCFLCVNRRSSAVPPAFNSFV
jgi:hypothetical protein